MTTFATIISEARTFLQDTDTNRYSDADLLVYANEAIAEAKRIRPDFFYGTYSTALSTYATSDTVPLPIEYQSYLKDYIMARAEFRDDEYSVDGRIGSLMARFKGGLIAL
tara:strand:- start:184 stop:513 length:330 start_codon:yes stop_codon:yes gene_type:complete